MPTDLKTKTAQGFFWGALNNGAMQVLNAVFGIVLARKLDQADYGLIGMLTIFTLIANSLQDSGFVTALTNKRNATHHDYNFFISSSFAAHPSSLISSTNPSSRPSRATSLSASLLPRSALCLVPSCSDR